MEACGCRMMQSGVWGRNERNEQGLICILRLKATFLLRAKLKGWGNA